MREYAHTAVVSIGSTCFQKLGWYVRAGFTKIHPDAVWPAVAMAIRFWMRSSPSEREAPVYVIGTEVPTPGGATHSLDHLQVTFIAAAEHTLDVTQGWAEQTE